MKLLNTALAVLMVGAATAFDFHNVTDPRTYSRCGSREPSGDMVQAVERLVAASRTDPMIAVIANATKVTLDVYFHVVSVGSTPAEGNIPDDAIHKQMDVINADYGPAGISFKLIDISRTVNANWSRSGLDSPEGFAMKSALRRGSYKDVNVYVAKMQSSALGWCTFPEAEVKDDILIKDGCTINYNTLPGGVAPYNLGRTLTHELGHWLSLFHTFQGGCSGVGDMVDDTPAEAGPMYGCPTVIPDTCKENAGLDPVHNFMDYTDDRCMTEFTPGQITRMFQGVQQFRGITVLDRRRTLRGSLPFGAHRY